QVTVEPLMAPENLAPGSLDDFWSRIAAEDRDWEKKCEQSRKARKVLRYLARLEHSSARVALETIDANHPAASTSGTENMVAFYTDRYPENPLVIRGPGAGPEVTAAGVFADILAAAAVLGNR
ncbi:MAG: bifunctional aspartate kinase/homoserine dehydrogenase I, partial [Acidobacteriota bacterium]